MAGDPQAALQQAAQGLVLTESAARKYFGEDKPMGKPLRLKQQCDTEQTFEATGVLKDLPLQFAHPVLTYTVSGGASDC